MKTLILTALMIGLVGYAEEGLKIGASEITHPKQLVIKEIDRVSKKLDCDNPIIENMTWKEALIMLIKDYDERTMKRCK